MREPDPWRFVFRPEGDQREYRQGADALDEQLRYELTQLWRRAAEAVARYRGESRAVINSNR